jgi:hypothetical protein
MNQAMQTRTGQRTPPLQVGDLIQFSGLPYWTSVVADKIGLVVAVRYLDITTRAKHPAAVGTQTRWIIDRFEWDAMIEGKIMCQFTFDPIIDSHLGKFINER